MQYSSIMSSSAFSMTTSRFSGLDYQINVPHNKLSAFSLCLEELDAPRKGQIFHTAVDPTCMYSMPNTSVAPIGIAAETAVTKLTDIREEVVNRIYQYLEIPGISKLGSFQNSYPSSESSSGDRQLAERLDRTPTTMKSWPPQFLVIPTATARSRGSGSTGVISGSAAQPVAHNYATATPCEHVDDRKRLRVKKGYIYYVCHRCGCKWRIPAHRRLRAKEAQQALQRDKLGELLRTLELNGKP